MSYKVYVYGSRKAFPAEGLAVGTTLPVDVFVNEGNVFTKVYGSGQFFGPGERADLLQRGVNEVYVDARDTRELERYLQRTSPESPADPEDPATVREYVGHKTSYFQVDRTSLLPGAPVGFGIYRFFDLRLIPLVEVTEGAPGVIPAGLSAVPGDIVIRNEDIPLYREYIDALLGGDAGLAVPPGDRERIRTVAIKERSKTVVKDLLEDPRSGENIRKGKKVVSEMTDCILSNRDVLHDLISLSSYDMYTYTHSVNVAVLSVGIGIAHGLDRAAVEALGVGALLHDIGKSHVPPEILNKPGRLSDQEFDVVKTHVVEGEKILQGNETVPGDSRTAVLQHHERLSGGGYPYRISGTAVTTFGRICAIADCYDAMTTNRPYSRSGTPYQALFYLKGQPQDYDGGLLSTFIRVLGKVPEPAIAGELSLPAG